MLKFKVKQSKPVKRIAVISFQIPVGLEKRLCELAQRHNLSRQELIRQILEHYLAEED